MHTTMKAAKPRCQTDVEEFAYARVKRACTRKVAPEEIPTPGHRAQPIPTGCRDGIVCRSGADDEAKPDDLPQPSMASKQAVDTVDLVTPEQAIVGGSASEPSHEHDSTEATGLKRSISTDVIMKDKWKCQDPQRCYPGLLGLCHSDRRLLK